MADSGKLYGVPLNIGVRNQIAYRAKNLVSKDKDVQDLMVSNNRGAWVTLTSGAQTLSEETVKLKNTLKIFKNNELVEKVLGDKSTMGNQLAQANVLTGGVLYGRIEDGKLKYNRRKGISFDKPYSPLGNESSYEHNPEFGFQPMMGITDFKIVTQSAFGTLRKATITIKAFTPDQLSILETLYFRPGFTMLIEWGNSSYIDANGEISSYNLGISKTFAEGNIKDKKETVDGKEVIITAIQQMKSMIKENREFSGGNYDGVIGKVVNFSWKLANDQSYDCTIDVLSEGNVIDAVKTTFTPNSNSELEKFKTKDTAETSATSDDILIDALEAFKLDKTTRKEYIKEVYGDNKMDVYYSDHFMVENEEAEEEEAKYIDDKFYFLTLRDFCVVFNKIILEGQNTGNIDVKFNTKMDRSVMTTFPGHISNDPGVCVMPFRKGLPYTPNPSTSDIDFTKEVNLYGGLTKPAKRTFFGAPMTPEPLYLPRPNPRKYANFGEGKGKKVPLEAGQAATFLPEKFKDEYSDDTPYKILINIDHLINIQESFRDQQNEDREVKAVVSQFFNKLLSDINSSLGGINNLACFFDEDNSEWIIIDHNCFDLAAGASTDKPSTEPPLLNIIGLKTEISSLDIQSKISNQMFNQLAITATASGQKVEESIDNFTRYNVNVSDRYEPFVKPEKKTNKKTSSTNWKEAKEVGPKAISKPWHRYINGSVEGDKVQKKFYSQEAFDAMKPAHAQYMSALNDQRQGKNREAGIKKSFNGGLLPIELSFTIRGITGMKIGEAFVINEVLLPQRSRGKIGFSITGIDHSISINNEWTTNITTAMYNLPDTEIPIEDEYEEPYKVEEAPPIEGPKETPNANRLRAAIAAAGYREKKKKGYTTGELTSATDASPNTTGVVDIIPEVADLGIAVIRAVKREIPGITLTFTGGNDKYHHNPDWDYVSRHASGRALDFVISPYSAESYKKVLSIIESFAAGENDQVRFKDEYKKLTAQGTGAHFHISWGKGSEGKKELAAAIKKAEKGSIVKRNI